jgi:hypothetical protein
VRAPAFLGRRRPARRLADEETLAAIARLPKDHPVHRPSAMVQAWLDANPEARERLGGERPYAASLAEDGQDSLRRRLGPVWRPFPAAQTRPMGALPPNAAVAPARAASTDLGAMRQAADGLKAIDWAALDEARKVEGATHASVRQVADPLTAPSWPVTEAARFHDEVAARRRPVLGPDQARHGDAARRRAEALTYPPCDGSYTATAYAALLSRVSAITGTAGLAPGQLARPALESAL